MSSDESTSAANSSGDEGAPESPTGNEDAPRSPTGSEGSPVDSLAQTTSSEEDHSEDAHSDVNEPPKAARSSDTAGDSGNFVLFNVEELVASSSNEEFYETRTFNLLNESKRKLARPQLQEGLGWGENFSLLKQEILHKFV